MARILLLYGMMLGAQLIRTMLAQGPFYYSEVAQCIKEATGEADAVFLISRHPVMWSDTGFIELPVRLVFRDSIASLPKHAVVRAANHATDEQRKKKKKDNEERKRWSKQRGKRRQGSSEEEEEEEDDGSMSPISWVDLATGDEDPSSP